MAVNADELYTRMVTAGADAFGDGWSQAKKFAEVELKTIAHRIDDIGKGVKNGDFDLPTAKLLMTMQVNLAIAAIAGSTVLLTLAVEAAVNAVLDSVRDFVNGALGVALL